MAIRANRFRSMYEGMTRPESATTFPIHVFKRGANQASRRMERLGDRDSVFKTTLLHMTEQFHGKEVFLVGSCNQSTMLAQRTQKLIEQINPDAVLVQTSPEWWEQARMLRFVDSQEEMNQYNKDLDKLSNGRYHDFYWSNRRWVFLARFYSYYALWMAHFRFGHDFKMFRPGLEAKFACEAAERVGARLDFLGPELDHKTWERLHHETRMNIPEYLMKRFQYKNTEYASENMDNYDMINTVGPQAFTEKCLDTYKVNWYIQATDIFFPKLKKVFVDERDKELFQQIDQAKGDKIVVLVNQWHMEGIEHRWCARYGQVPRSVEFPEGINPIGDFNLRQGLFTRMYNSLQREIKSKNTKGKPATHADWINGYFRESNFQYEHRDM